MAYRPFDTLHPPPPPLSPLSHPPFQSISSSSSSVRLIEFRCPKSRIPLCSRVSFEEKREKEKKRDTKMKTNYLSRESRRRIIALPNPDLEARRSARLLPISTPFPTIVTNTGRNPEEMRKIMKERDVK